ncbi:MAG TPA: phage/plasmid primase, P4 family [Nitrososphaeraceae archaeon]|jgi:putative DNA primase/helicase
MIFSRDYFDKLSREQRSVLRKCGIPMDTEEIIKMDDERFNDLIYAEYIDLSDYELNLLLILKDEIKKGRKEVNKKRDRLYSLLEEEAKHHQWYGNNSNDHKHSTTFESSIYEDEVDESDRSEVFDLCRDGIATILYNYHLKTMRDNYEQWHYSHTKGIFVQEGEFLVKEVMQSIVGTKLTTKLFNEAKNEIERRSLMRRTEFDRDIEWMATNNCMVNLLTGESFTFSPNFLCTTKLPVTLDHRYIKDACANCLRLVKWHDSEIMKFLNSIMDPEDIDLILDFLAYCMWRDYRQNFWLLLHGAGSNGKSTLLSLIQRFLGTDNVSSESLDRLLHNQFSIANLYQKIANIDADVSQDVILNNTGILKILTGNDVITGEYKFKTSFKFTNHAKLIMSCNKISQTGDDTDAFYRRVLIISFKKQFFGKNDDRKIIAKLTTEQELTGLLHELLSRIPRIVNEGLRQVTNESLAETYRKYSWGSDPLKYFCDRAIMLDTTAKVPKMDMYNHYIKFCNAEGLPTESEQSFSRKFRKNTDLQTKQFRLNHDKVYCWVGVRLAEWKLRQESLAALEEIKISEFTSAQREELK